MKVQSINKQNTRNNQQSFNAKIVELDPQVVKKFGEGLFVDRLTDSIKDIKAIKLDIDGKKIDPNVRIKSFANSEDDIANIILEDPENPSITHSLTYTKKHANIQSVALDIVNAIRDGAKAFEESQAYVDGKIQSFLAKFNSTK